MCARGEFAVPGYLGTVMALTPYSASSADAASPAGPAPTMRTSVSMVGMAKWPPRARPGRVEGGKGSERSAGMRGGHEGGEVVGLQERRWRWRAPVEQAPGALEVLGRPPRILGDAV